MDEELKQKLKRILNNLLWAEVKQIDAPCSADSHRHTAILGLSKLLPDYKAGNEEVQKELDDINEIYANEPWIKHFI